MLITCPECQLPVSDKALNCPHCGYPFQKASKPSKYHTKSHMRLPNGFGQITELKNRRLRKPFRAMVTVGKTPEGKPISKILKPEGYFATYNEAYLALVEYNKNPYDLDETMTVIELYNRWSAEYFENINDSSKRSIKSAWDKCSSVYTMRAKDLRVRHIKGCMESCESDNIKNRIKSMFNLMLDYALEYEIVEKNYARDFKIERITSKTQHKSFTDEEMEILWKNINIPYVNYILIQCYTGFRPQELCDLRIENINLEDNSIVGGMKTEAGTNRYVPIHSKILPLVKKIKAMSEMLNSPYLCCDLDGSKLTYDKYNKRFHRIMEDLNLGEGHRPHDPRKQFITMAKNMEVNEYAVKMLVGHAISDITEKIYTDRKEDWLRTEIEKIK